jgi:hypothetical protein
MDLQYTYYYYKKSYPFFGFLYSTVATSLTIIPSITIVNSEHINRKLESETCGVIRMRRKLIEI